MGKAAAARKLAAAAAYGGGGLSLLGGASYGVLNARGRLARKTIGQVREDPPPDATGWYGRGRPGPAFRLALLGDSERRRLRRRPGRGDPGRAARQRHLRARRPSGLPARLRGGRRPVPPPGRPDRPGAADRARRRGDPDRRQRRHPQDAAGRVGAAPLRGRTPAARGRRRGRRRHLPGPRHGPADRAAAQAGGPDLVPPARRGPDHRGDRGGRPDRLAGLDPRAGVRRRPGGAVRARPVPPVGRGLSGADQRADPVRAGGPRARRPTTRPGRSRSAARRVLPVTQAAVQAVKQTGTELDGTEVGGDRLGVRGLWVELRHRRSRPQAEGEAPARDRDRGRVQASRRRPGRSSACPRPGPARRRRPGRRPSRPARR